MKYIFTLIAFVITFMPVASMATGPVISAWREIARGLHYKSLNVQVGKEIVNLHSLKINPRLVKIRPVFSGKKDTAKNMKEKAGALAITNANFFDSKGESLGLVVIDKVTLHPVKIITWWSVFCMNGSTVKIMTSSEYREGLCEQAVEAGPRLVINGSIPKLKQEMSRKTAVGIRNNKEVILIVSEQPLPIRELAQIFVRPESKNGLDCPNALNLDGGSSSQMYLQARGYTVDIPSFVSYPVGLGVFSK